LIDDAKHPVVASRVRVVDLRLPAISVADLLERGTRGDAEDLMGIDRETERGNHGRTTL
jgi:hypothetical protein